MHIGSLASLLQEMLNFYMKAPYWQSFCDFVDLICAMHSINSKVDVINAMHVNLYLFSETHRIITSELKALDIIVKHYTCRERITILVLSLCARI